MAANPDVLTAALAQVDQGFAAFALLANAKTPVTPNGFKNATTNPEWVRKQLETPAAGNYGITWPEAADELVVAFDLDNGSDGTERPWQDRLADLITRIGPLPATKATTTPSGGRHAFYRWPRSTPIPSGDELFGFTVRWPGRGYLVGPGSSINGTAYAEGPVRAIADLPDAWVAAAIAERRPSARQNGQRGLITVGPGAYALPDVIPAGRRYAAVRDYVASRYNAGLSEPELWELVRTQVAPRFVSPKTDDELRADFARATAKLGERLGAPARTPIVPRTPEEVGASSIDAADLLELDIPPLSWIVPDLLPEGTTILAGPPKLGKSCLVYQVAVEVALGGDLLGREIEQGDVLYLALEDGKRRGQTRLRAALGARSMPRGRLEVRWSAPKLGEGLEQELLDWLDQHPNARLVAIDTLQRVRARGDARRNAYEVDVEDLGRLQSLFRDRAVGLLVVHHSKKDAGDDFLASVSGTYGITGSADTTLVIQRKRLETFGKLVVTGRDIAELEEPVQFNGMTWSAAPRSLAEASFEQAEVYKVIEAEGPIFAKAIADLVGSTRDAVQKLVTKMVTTGSIARSTGGYVVAGARIREGAGSLTATHSAHSDEGVEGADEHEAGHIAHSAHSARSADSGPETLARVTREGITHSTHSPHPEEEGRVSGVSGHTRGRAVPRGGAREAGPVLTVVDGGPGTTVHCRYFTDHQTRHRRTASGWICDICSPEEAS